MISEFAGEEGGGGAPLYRGGGSKRRRCCLGREGSSSSSERYAIARTRNARGSTSKNLVFHLYQVILQSILISCEMFFPDGDHFLDHLLKLQEAFSFEQKQFLLIDCHRTKMNIQWLNKPALH
ncbi:hypothetical protein ACSQ67_022727 [Phaseolus vulgaris]